MFDYDPKPMTGPEHVREAMRLATLANAEKWPMAHGDFDRPTEDERHRALATAQIHATLAQTAALFDAARYAAQPGEVHMGWAEVFNVRPF